MKRAQVSIEFFLIATFALALAAALLTTAEAQARSVSEIDRAALAKNALDGVTRAANRAWLMGNGTRLQVDVFIPDNSVCLIYNATQQRLYCDAGIRCPTDPSTYCNAYGPLVLPTGGVRFDASCPPTSGTRGWHLVTLLHNGTTVNATCTALQ